MDINRITRQFLKFGLVGLSNTLISYAIYVAMVYCGFHYLIASTIGFVFSVVNAFFWSDRYVFNREKCGKFSLLISFAKTLLAYGFSGFILANLLLILMIDVMHISEYIAPLLSLVITVPFNFFLNKFWAFQDKK